MLSVLFDYTAVCPKDAIVEKQTGTRSSVYLLLQHALAPFPIQQHKILAVISSKMNILNCSYADDGWS